MVFALIIEPSPSPLPQHDYLREGRFGFRFAVEAHYFCFRYLIARAPLDIGEVWCSSISSMIHTTSGFYITMPLPPTSASFRRHMLAIDFASRMPLRTAAMESAEEEAFWAMPRRIMYRKQMMPKRFINIDSFLPWSRHDTGRWLRFAGSLFSWFPGISPPLTRTLPNLIIIVCHDNYDGCNMSALPWQCPLRLTGVAVAHSW